MKWHYDLTGGKQVIRDVPVYDAAGMANGELVMLGTTDPDSDADMGIAFITACTGTSAEAVDALGIICEDFSTAATIDNTPTTDVKYLKAIVNPFAIYMAEYSQHADHDVAIASGATDTSVTITSIEDDLDGGYIYFPLASGGAAGSLRLITEDDGSALTVYAAITTTTNDTVIKILPVNHRLVRITSDSLKIKSEAAASDGVSLAIVENWIRARSIPMQPIRYANHKSLSGLTGVNIYADIAMLDHVYNNA